MALPFDWGSWDVVRYCWPGISCGDAGGWLSGIGALVAAGVAVQLARSSDRLAQRRARRVAAMIFFEEAVSISHRAVKTLKSGRFGPGDYYWEEQTLHSQRHRVADLPDYEGRVIQRLTSKIRAINIGIDVLLKTPDRIAALAAMTSEQRESLRGVKTKMPDQKALLSEIAVVCRLAIDQAGRLAPLVGPSIKGDIIALEEVRDELEALQLRDAAAAKAPEPKGQGA